MTSEPYWANCSLLVSTHPSLILPQQDVGHVEILPHNGWHSTAHRVHVRSAVVCRLPPHYQCHNAWGHEGTCRSLNGHLHQSWSHVQQSFPPTCYTRIVITRPQWPSSRQDEAMMNGYNHVLSNSVGWFASGATSHNQSTLTVPLI